MDLDKKITFKRKIELWWKFEAQYYWYNLKLGLNNTFNWSKTIWKDDANINTSLYTIIQKKLELDAKKLRKQNWYENSIRQAEIYELCCRLISKITDGYYSMEYTEYVKSNIYFKPCDDGSGCSTMEEDVISENYDLLFQKYTLMYKKVVNMDNPFFGKDDKDAIAMSICYYNDLRCHDLIIKILKKYLYINY